MDQDIGQMNFTNKLESFNTTVNGFKHIEFGNHELLKKEVNENTAGI